jgi:abortive infection bacteriophage resistance protein
MVKLMKYNKLSIPISEQILKLKQRGLEFKDDAKAAHYLSNISYYRLRAYTYPFQDNVNPGHPFILKVSFEDIVQLYVFDRQLRLLIFNAIEKIEIALRTQIIYQYSLVYGGHWHINPSLYNNSVYFAEQIASLQKEVDRSNETFIKHYKATYTDPKTPPSWMSLEVTSMGLLSKLFSNLKNDVCKDTIAKHFGLKDPDILKNWMYCFSIIRNTCAHHGRIWNRRLPQVILPKKPLNQFIDKRDIYTNKIYASICCVQYILNIISPQHGFKEKLLALVTNCPLLQEKEIGFPKNWQGEKLWH